VAVLPVLGLKVYPAEATSGLNVDPLLLPSTDSVSVRVAHALDGGRSRVTDPIDCAEPRSGTDAEPDDHVDGEIQKGDREAADEQHGLQDQAGREHVLVAEGVVPLSLGEEPDDRAREDEHEYGETKERGAEPESARRSRDSDLPRALERAASLERIKRPVAAAHG